MDNAERRLHDAKLGAAIDNATFKLPDGYCLVIEITGGSHFVSLGESTAFDVLTDDDMPLSDAIDKAVSFAVDDAKDRG
jgi:hypothetical protein